MKIDKILQINSRVEIAKLYPENEEDQIIGLSLIQEIDNNSFLIMVPIQNRHVLYLTKGDEVIVWITVDNARYAFESIVMNEKVEIGIKYFELKKPQKLTSSERRNFVRVKKFLPIKYKVIKDGKEDNWESIQASEEASMLDISGKGISLSVNKPLLRDLLMVLAIPLEMNNVTLITKVLGRVVRSEKTDSFYKIGINFVNISEKQEDLIMKYVFDTLRKFIQINRDDF